MLQAVVSSYVGQGGPVASQTVSALLPMKLSPQSVRNTLSSLGELGLVGKAHRSAGRVPTDLGLRVFVEQLLTPRELGPFEKRELQRGLDHGHRDDLAEVTTRLLFERTHQLGFFRTPQLEGMVLRHVSLVRVSRERVLAILLTAEGRTFQRVIEEPGQDDQAELDRLASQLSRRVAGRTLRAVRRHLLREARALRSQVELLLERMLQGDAAPEPGHEGDAVVFSTRLVLLDQPEFQQPERLRELLRALEEKGRLVEILDRVADAPGVHVAFGAEVGDPSLRRCSVVIASYGRSGAAAGALGVIGPVRMDYARVIPLVGYISHLLSETNDA